MRIPIPIIQQRRQRVLQVPGRCQACGADKGFEIEQEQLRVWLAFLPMGGSNTRLVGRCNACGVAAPPSVLAKAKVPIVFRFGCLFFLVLPLAALGAFYIIDKVTTDARNRAQYEIEQQARRSAAAEKEERWAAQTACNDAYKKAKDAERACMKVLDDVENAITKDIHKEKARAPSDVSMLLKAPFVVSARPLVPDSPYFGDSPCPFNDSKSPLLVPECSVSNVSVDAVRARTKELVAAAAALGPPDRWAVVTWRCNDWSCTSQAYWIDRPTKTLLALARVTKGKTADEAADKKALQKALGDALAKWK